MKHKNDADADANADADKTNGSVNGSLHGLANGLANGPTKTAAPPAGRVFGPQDRRRVPRHRESTPDAEALSLSQALPRRQMVGMIDSGMRFVLECGHALSSNAALDADCRTGCRECFHNRMCAAGRLIEPENDPLPHQSPASSNPAPSPRSCPWWEWQDR